MHKTIGLLFLALALPLVPSSLRAESGAPSLLPSQLNEQTADAAFQKAFDPNTAAGLSVAVMRDGKIILAKGYGKASLASGKAVTPETRFAIGSITKQFTSACVLLLAEEGKLSVQDKVAKYYPKLTQANEITLLDLMNHVAGYPDYYPLDFVDRRMKKSIEPDRLLELYAGQKLDFAPGTRWSYSNTGFVLLGRVVEKVSGQPLGKFMETRLFGPLGLTHTVYEPRLPGADYALGYTDFALSKIETVSPEARGWVGGAGAIYSTPADLAKWDLALMDGKVLKPDSYRLMTTSRLLADGASTGYGCGLAVSEGYGVAILSHGGAVSGFSASNKMIPETRSAIILCANKDSGLEGAAEKAILPALTAPTSAAAPGESSGKPKSNAPRMKRFIPTMAGPPAEEVARGYFLALQRGDLKGVALGEEFRYYLNRKRVASAAARLQALGELSNVQAAPPGERGGMEVRYITFTVGTRQVGGLMYRSPDGRIQQLIIR